MSENNALIIFGATGDLTYQKLLPALAKIKEQHPQLFSRVFLIGRQVNNLQDYFTYGQDHGLEVHPIQSLLPHLEYVYMQASDNQDYPPLAEKLKSYRGRWFYLATPPAMFTVITEALNRSGALMKGNPHHRCAYEKPFGENQVTAEVLNDLLHEYLLENQLYRVDHYLAKPLIQNLLKIRMQWQTIGMESYFDHPHVESITIRAYETIGILSRGKFYDQTGALKDMIQGHLLETLALLTMKLPPRIDDIAAIQKEKVTILSSLKPNHDRIRFGQYQGYLNELYINPQSLTETFVRLPLSIDLPRWQNVKVELITGKKLSEKRTDIKVCFKQGGCLHFHISPTVKVSVDPSLLDSLPPRIQQHLHALSHHAFNQADAYVTIFKDWMQGNQTLFPSSEEIMATWRLIDSIKKTPRLPIIYRDERDVLTN